MPLSATALPSRRHITPAVARVLGVIAMSFTAFAVLSAAPPAGAEPRPPATDGRATPAPSTRSVWAEAFAALSRAADAGSVDAARLALQMHRLGPQVYGMHFDASAEQLQRWQQRLASAAPGCERGVA